MSVKAKAKQLSKWSMIIGSVWIMVFTALKAVWGIFTVNAFGLTQWEIILSASFIVIMFSPVFASIWIDKIVNREVSCVPKD